MSIEMPRSPRDPEYFIVLLIHRMDGKRLAYLCMTNESVQPK